MKNFMVWTLPLLGLSSACFAQLPAQKCDCKSYPFLPEPPCYGKCVAILSSTRNPDLSSIKGIDTEVANSIKAIAADQQRRNAIDFSRIGGKSDLQQTVNAIKDKNSKNIENEREENQLHKKQFQQNQLQINKSQQNLPQENQFQQNKIQEKKFQRNQLQQNQPQR